MFRKIPRTSAVAVGMIALLMGCVSTTAREAPALVLDEHVWVTFYDVPSRRFRSIRDAFVRKDFVTAARDLDVSITYLSIELDRASESLEVPLAELVANLESLRLNLFDETVAVGDLDAAFARAHWLLAQHYLAGAREARDEGDGPLAGDFMWATAHHLERAVLWSNATIDRRLVKSLESARRMATRLKSGKKGAAAFRDGPVRAISKTLVSVGEHLDRPLRIDP